MRKMGLAVFLVIVIGWALPPTVRAQSSDPQFQELLKKINGRRYAYSYPGAVVFADIQGNAVVFGFDAGKGYYSKPCPRRVQIRGRETTVPIVYESEDCPFPPTGQAHFDFHSVTVLISEDGERIIKRAHNDDGTIGDTVFLPQR